MGVSALKLPRFSDQELAAEIRATDPTTDLDVNKIYLMVKAIKLARFTKAPPLSWIDKPLGAPEPNDLILASGRHIASWKPLKMFGIVRSYLVHAPIST